MNTIKKIGSIAGIVLISGTLIHSVSYKKPDPKTEIGGRYYPSTMDFCV